MAKVANSGRGVADDIQPTVNATGPTAWWRYGVVAIAIVAFLLLLMQVFGGGAPSTDVAPGTPVTVPTTTPVPQA